jgi:DNA-binding FadR family transcriptional regulator
METQTSRRARGGPARRHWDGAVRVETHKGARLREKPQLIADELRMLIASGELSDGETLGREPELIDRFGVSRPSLREALRILEAEGLITVVRGMYGRVIVHRPNERMTARTAALVLHSRNVSIADVIEAYSLLEPLAARAIAGMRGRRTVIAELRPLIEEQEVAIDDPEAFLAANARFHRRLVALAGNKTLSIVAEMLNEVVTRAVTTLTRAAVDTVGSRPTRRRAIRSQRRLLDLLEAGVPSAAEEYWRAHMAAVGKLMLGQEASALVDLVPHYT